MNTNQSRTYLMTRKFNKRDTVNSPQLTKRARKSKRTENS